MRYYDITLTQPGSSKAVRQWTSYLNGKPDPGALNLMFDIPVSYYATPVGGQTITIEGISLADLSQAQDFAGMNLTLKGGMGGGLPLENKAQQGTIVQGTIFQSFGNWVGTEMTLDFVLNPAVFTNDNPGNFVLNWTKGQKLSDALRATLSAAYQKQKLPIDMRISDQWVADIDLPHSADTLEGLASQIAEQTADQPNGPVNIAIQNGRITVQDETYKPSPIQIAFTDLIGQPTWIDVNTMQIKTVMRADLLVGSEIKMPDGYLNAPGAVTTAAQSQPSSLKYKPTFTQSFLVTQLRQVGDFRSTDSGEWATIFNCVQL